MLLISHYITVIVVTVTMVIHGSELVCNSLDHKQDSGSKRQMCTRHSRFTLENSCSDDDVIPYSVGNFCV
jgi:hypothetical protein